MTKDLYDQSPVFRTAMDECARLLRPLLPAQYPLLTQLLYGSTDEELTEAFRDASVVQPSIFAIEYALAQVLRRDFGIQVSSTAPLGSVDVFGVVESGRHATLLGDALCAVGAQLDAPAARACKHAVVV